MVDFRIKPHSIYPNIRVVEILIDGKVAAMIYPLGEKGIKLVSAHIEETAKEEGFVGEVIEDDGSRTWPSIPAVLVTFNPSPYVIIGGKIIKISPKDS